MLYRPATFRQNMLLLALALEIVLCTVTLEAVGDASKGKAKRESKKAGQNKIMDTLTIFGSVGEAAEQSTTAAQTFPSAFLPLNAPPQVISSPPPYSNQAGGFWQTQNNSICPQTTSYFKIVQQSGTALSTPQATCAGSGMLLAKLTSNNIQDAISAVSSCVGNNAGVWVGHWNGNDYGRQCLSLTILPSGTDARIEAPGSCTGPMASLCEPNSGSYFQRFKLECIWQCSLCANQYFPDQCTSRLPWPLAHAAAVCSKFNTVLYERSPQIRTTANG